MLKVEHLISITAVGSLKEELKPGELVIPDQYFDQTFKREKTFFEDGVVAHVSLADPTCPVLGQLAFRLAREAGSARPPGRHVLQHGGAAIFQPRRVAGQPAAWAIR